MPERQRTNAKNASKQEPKEKISRLFRRRPCQLNEKAGFRVRKYRTEQLHRRQLHHLRTPRAAADQHREKVFPDTLYNGVQPRPLVLEDSMKRSKTGLSRRHGSRRHHMYGHGWTHGSTSDGTGRKRGEGAVGAANEKAGNVVPCPPSRHLFVDLYFVGGLKPPISDLIPPPTLGGRGVIDP